MASNKEKAKPGVAWSGGFVLRAVGGSHANGLLSPAFIPPEEETEMRLGDDLPGAALGRLPRAIVFGPFRTLGFGSLGSHREEPLIMR